MKNATPDIFYLMFAQKIFEGIFKDNYFQFRIPQIFRHFNVLDDV